MKTTLQKSKLKLKKVAIIACVVGGTIISSSSSYAALIMSDDISSGKWYKHSSQSANSEFAVSQGKGLFSTHQTTQWQELGSYQGWGVSDMNHYGASWKTSMDNGLTWSNYGREDLTVGQQVQFQFDMGSMSTGRGHKANIFKSWLDWGVNLGTFDENGVNVGGDYHFDNSNVLVSGSNMVREAQYIGHDPITNEDINLHEDYTKNISFWSDIIELDSSHIGTAYLRSRVVCTESLHKKMPAHSHDGENSQWVHSTDFYERGLDPYFNLGQGEIEDWTFNVSAATSVPEPSAFALLGLGLAGLVFARKHKK